MTAILGLKVFGLCTLIAFAFSFSVLFLKHLYVMVDASKHPEKKYKIGLAFFIEIISIWSWVGLIHILVGILSALCSTGVCIVGAIVGFIALIAGHYVMDVMALLLLVLCMLPFVKDEDKFKAHLDRYMNYHEKYNFL